MPGFFSLEGKRMKSNVYVNRILNMKKIKFIGLDMDHTLIRYNATNFESLVFKLVVEQLLVKKQYPVLIKSLKYFIYKGKKERNCK